MKGLYNKHDFKLLSECLTKTDSINSFTTTNDNQILIGYPDGRLYSFELDGNSRELD